jgi:hypothetical protein
MKCLCGFKQKPDNVVILKHHLEDCLTTGTLKDMFPEPHVVWRGAEFTVVKELDEGEAALELGIKRPEAARVRIENKIAAKQSTIQAAVQNLETPEEIIEAIENVPDVVEEAPVKKPAPAKPKAPVKKPASKSK